MYKVLLVDDERMILDGIATIVDWNSQGAELIGKVLNGLEALDLMEQNTPDIVITDITMPGLDGIGLVKKAKEKHPEVKWIFLSGYSEFEYAQQAMRYGVKHYLLKPCNEQQIIEALTEVIKEIRREKATESYIHSMEEKATKSTMLQLENMLKQYFMYDLFSEDSLEIMKQMLQKLHFDKFNFLLFTIEEQRQYNRLHDLTNLIEKHLKAFRPLPIIIDHHIVVVVNSEPKLEKQIEEFHQAFHIDMSFSTVLSSSKSQIEQRMKLVHLLDQLFYQRKQAFVPPQEWTEFQTTINIKLPVDEIVFSIKKGQGKAALNYIIQLCDQFQKNLVTPKLAKGYFIQMFLLLMSKYKHHEVENRLQAISEMEQLMHLESFVPYFNNLFERLIKRGNEERNLSPVVQEILVYIEEEIANPELSLQWLASNRLYMNADYLGKIFKKEMGQRFSAFLTNYRIDKAVEIAEKEQDIKVFELAERIGFGNNPQYFSQLFKRIKGFTPSQIIQPN